MARRNTWNSKETAPELRPEVKKALDTLPKFGPKELFEGLEDIAALIDQTILETNEHLTSTENNPALHSVYVHLHNTNVALFRTLTQMTWMAHISSNSVSRSSAESLKNLKSMVEEHTAVIEQHKDKWEFIDDKVKEARAREQRGKDVPSYG